jgi:hypothetical protein
MLPEGVLKGDTSALAEVPAAKRDKSNNIRITLSPPAISRESCPLTARLADFSYLSNVLRRIFRLPAPDGRVVGGEAGSHGVVARVRRGLSGGALLDQHSHLGCVGPRYMTLATVDTMGDPAITNSGPAGNALTSRHPHHVPGQDPPAASATRRVRPDRSVGSAGPALVILPVPNFCIMVYVGIGLSRALARTANTRSEISAPRSDDFVPSRYS